MRGLALIAALTLASGGRFDRVNSRCIGGRSDRGLPCDSYAFLEFAPANGAGMGVACACSTVSGAKGEALTFARTSSATCTKTATGGLATTGIANGDLVTCSSGQPRVEYDSAGVLGLLMESAGQNVLLRSDALGNAAWADVGTPGVTDGATDPFNTSTADTLDDNDAAAFEGRSQAVTVSAATSYTMFCYLKAGTATTARLSLDGTTCDFTGLSGTTWTKAGCSDASSSGVSISAQVLVGNATTVTGTIIVGGCQVETGTYASSYIPTTAAAVTRQADDATFTGSFPNAPMSFAATADFAGAARTNYAALATLYSNATSYVLLGQLTGSVAGMESYSGGFNGKSIAATALATGDRPFGYVNAVSTANGVLGGKNATLGTASGSSPPAATHATLRLNGFSAAGNLPINGIITRLCYDPSPTRCR